MGILLSVAQLLHRYRPDRPIGPLEALIDLDSEVSFQQRTKPKRLQPDYPRGYHRIEQVIENEAIIPLHTYQIVFGGVEHLLDPGICEQRTQLTQIVERQRIDQPILVAG